MGRNLEKRKEYMKNYMRNYMKNYNAKHPELKEYRSNWQKENGEKCRLATKKHNHKIKSKIMEILGNKCFRCGLESKIISIYDIHHIDRTIKDKSLKRMSLEYVIKNKDKLMLLCANCHRIEHSD